MKIRITLVAIAFLGLLTGIAFAGPLVLSELDVKPWIHRAQGPKADFEVETIFANFTILDPEDSASDVDELSVGYHLWVNVTNPSDVNARLLIVDFVAGGEFTPFSGLPVIDENSFYGSGWNAEGAFVDGKWYNLTWVDGTSPSFDRDGNLYPSPFPVTEQTGYWMEGVQLYETIKNGTVVTIYMNMNGTWTDVTGRIKMDEPTGGGNYVDCFVAKQRKVFQPYQHMPDVSVDPSTGETSEITVGHDASTVYIPAGKGYFDDYFKAGKSRIILIEGIRKIDSVGGNNKTIEVLNSGNITISIMTTNIADKEFIMENDTMQDTSSDTTELKTVELTKIDNSYIYNMDLLEEYSVTVDEWNAEVLLDPR